MSLRNRHPTEYKTFSDVLQDIMDAVAQACGEKHKYILSIGRKTCAYTGRFVKGQRRQIGIVFGYWLNLGNEKRIARDLTHEIAHFKQAERGKHKGVHYYRHHRFHNKAFHRIDEALWQKAEPLLFPPET